MDEVTALARELVAIPSHEDESAVGDYLVDWLNAETTATITRDDVGNVIARRGTGSPSLALIGHHDVVPPHPDQRRDDGELVTRIENDRLYGRGSADMKGALAAMMLAFRDAEPDGELVFTSFVGEETGGEGARHAVEAGFVPDIAVVGEGSAGYTTPGILDVVVAHRGRRGSTMTATGDAGHASRPEAAQNAIYRAIDGIEVIRNLTPPTTTVAGEELAGSIAVTTMSGGSAMNVIPDRCTVGLDERTVPGHRLPLAEAIADVPGVSVEITQDWPPMACDDLDLAGHVRDRIAAMQDATVGLSTKPHATDASWFAEAGSTTVIVGPAERGEAHTDDESVSIALLQAARHSYRAIAESPTPE